MKGEIQIMNMSKIIACALSVSIALASARLIYPAAMRVTDVDYETDTVTMETATGIVYAMRGTEDWAVDDVATVLMFSNGTRFVYDDEIIAARYSGFTYGHDVN